MGCARFVTREAFAAGFASVASPWRGRFAGDFASGFTGDSHFVTREAFVGAGGHAMARPYILPTFFVAKCICG
jgi:hypothetical protein